jgi:hypothetical protein
VDNDVFRAFFGNGLLIAPEIITMIKQHFLLRWWRKTDWQLGISFVAEYSTVPRRAVGFWELMARAETFNLLYTDRHCHTHSHTHSMPSKKYS